MATNLRELGLGEISWMGLLEPHPYFKLYLQYKYIFLMTELTFSTLILLLKLNRLFQLPSVIAQTKTHLL